MRRGYTVSRSTLPVRARAARAGGSSRSSTSASNRSGSARRQGLAVVRTFPCQLMDIEHHMSLNMLTNNCKASWKWAHAAAKVEGRVAVAAALAGVGPWGRC